jgi:threonyl-tRNA synthetase
LRYGEFGSCHRNEPSGSLHGIMRVRGFTQDDGHIFCTEDQILDECVAFTSLLQKVYSDFGFKEVIYKMSTRPEKRVGADESWDKAERALIESLERSGVEYQVQPGEGAFYGPKIEYSLKDAIGRVWQCGTIQVDFNMPGRLGSEYVAEDNSRKVPVMLHRAIVGSMERFIGILLENHAGAMPLWLAPVQVVVMNISAHQADYVETVVEALRQAGFRADADLRNEKINYKIREHSMQKLPYQIVIGDKEKAANKVAVRTRGGEDLGQMDLSVFIERLDSEAVPGSAA